MPIQLGLYARGRGGSLGRADGAATAAATVDPTQVDNASVQRTKHLVRQATAELREAHEDGAPLPAPAATPAVSNGSALRRAPSSPTSSFELLCELARKPENTDTLLKAHALNVYVEGLASPNASVSDASLQALLPQLLGRSLPQQLLEQVLETVLGKSWDTHTDSGQQPLKALVTLVQQPACADQLTMPHKFDTVLRLIEIKALSPHRNLDAARYALLAVDGILKHAATVTVEQAARVVTQANRVLSLEEDSRSLPSRHASRTPWSEEAEVNSKALEALMAAARHTMRMATERHPGSELPGAPEQESWVPDPDGQGGLVRRSSLQRGPSSVPRWP